MQPNQPNFDPIQPTEQPQPQPQPTQPQYTDPAPVATPVSQPYETPTVTAAPFEALVVTSPISPEAQPVDTTFAPAPVAPTTPAVPAQKTSHKVLFIVLAAIIGLVVVVAGVYLAVTLTSSTN